jgi:hypothetical protein
MKLIRLYDDLIYMVFCDKFGLLVIKEIQTHTKDFYEINVPKLSGLKISLAYDSPY